LIGKPLPDIAAIVLAAGQGQRFGGNKLLADVQGQALVVHSLLPWLQIFDRVTVVVRPGGLPLIEAVQSATVLDARRVDWAMVAEDATGMGDSLAAGVRLCQNAEGWLIGLADMPALSAASIAAVHQALIDGRPLAAPTFNGQRGHPVGFSRSYRDALMALQGDQGAKSLLQSDADRLCLIPVADRGVVLDIDIPEDLKLLRR
jgi:molybdenum cofactor cytidylyltransferase